MDPDELLKELLAEARMTVAVNVDKDAIKQAERVIDLHDWLSKGGFLPKAWDVPRTSYSQGTSGL